LPLLVQGKNEKRTREHDLELLVQKMMKKWSAAYFYSFEVEEQIAFYQNMIDEMRGLFEIAEFPEGANGGEIYDYYFREAGNFTIRRVIPIEGKIFINYFSKTEIGQDSPDLKLLKDNLVSIAGFVAFLLFRFSESNSIAFSSIKEVYMDASDEKNNCFLSIISNRHSQRVVFDNGKPVPSKSKEHETQFEEDENIALECSNSDTSKGIDELGDILELEEKEAPGYSIRKAASPKYEKQDFPRNLSEFVGNANATCQLKILIENRLRLNRVIPHILFYGRPGLGKTTLGQIIASESKSYLHSFIANQLKVDNISDLLWRISTSDILFIDEIHSLDSRIEEIFYSVLQDFSFKKPNSSIAYRLPRFTIIGATTNKAKLAKPFLDRFTYSITLQSYSDTELLQIAYLYSQEHKKEYGIGLSQPAANLLVRISQNTPRILKNHLHQCIDIALSQGITKIESRVVESMMRLNNIDENGLDSLQQQYLHYLQKTDSPIGINALSSFLGCSEQDIVLLIEPYLIEKGFVLRTPRGRVVTEYGRIL